MWHTEEKLLGQAVLMVQEVTLSSLEQCSVSAWRGVRGQHGSPWAPGWGLWHGMARRGLVVLRRRRGWAFWVKLGSPFLRGEVSCSAASAGSRGSNRFTPTALPVIDVRGVCLAPSGETATRTSCGPRLWPSCNSEVLIIKRYRWKQELFWKSCHVTSWMMMGSAWTSGLSDRSVKCHEALVCVCFVLWLSGVLVGCWCWFCFVFWLENTKCQNAASCKVLRNCVLKYSWKHLQSGKTDEVRILKEALHLPTEYLMQAIIFIEIKQILHTYGQEG